MKQRSYLALFVLFLAIWLTACTEVEAIERKFVLKGLKGFKCPSLTGLDYAIRLSASGRVQCLSLNGQDCVTGLKTEDQCRDFIRQNSKAIKPKRCTPRQSFSKNSWCYAGRKFFYKKWQCPSETGLKVAIRMTSNFNVECLSKNGKSCWRGANVNKACRKANTCKKFRSRMKKVRCGKQHKKIWGHNGYFFNYNHWCKKAFAFYRFTGRMLYKKITGVNTPVRISPKGNIQCFSKDGKNCVWGIETRQQGREMIKALTHGGKFKRKYLTCGQHHLKHHKSSGFKDRNHWCRKAFRAIFKRRRNLSRASFNRRRWRPAKKLISTRKGRRFGRVKRITRRTNKGRRNRVRRRNSRKGRKNRRRSRKGKRFGRYIVKPNRAKITKAKRKFKLRINRYIKKAFSQFLKKPIVKKIRKAMRMRRFTKSPRRFSRFLRKLKKHVRGGRRFWTKLLEKIMKKKPLRKIIRFMVRQKYRPLRSRRSRKLSKRTRRMRRLRRRRSIKRTNRVIKKHFIKGLKFRKGRRGLKKLGRRGKQRRRGLKRRNRRNKRRTFRGRGKLRTAYSRRLPKSFAFNIKLNRIGYFTLGLQNRRPKRRNNRRRNGVVPANKRRRGGRRRHSWKGMRRGQWAFFGRHAIASQGRLRFLRKPLKSGDIITIWGHRGRVGFRINGDPNGYSYRLKHRRGLYFNASLKLRGDRISFIKKQGFIKRNKQIRRMVNKLVKTRMARKIKRIMKKGNIGRPKVVLRLRKIFERNGIKGKRGFWNRLFGRISRRRSISKVMRVIAHRRWIRRYRRYHIKRWRYIYARRLIAKRPWMGQFCRWSSFKRVNRRGLRRFLRKWRLYGRRFFRLVYKLIRRGGRCYRIIKTVNRRRRFIRNRRINRIIQTNLLSNITWQNGSQTYIHPSTGHRQMVSQQMLPKKFAVNIRINRLRRYHITLGVKINPFPRSYWWSYLGWYPGEWAIMDHRAVFAQQRCQWHSAYDGFSEGAVLTIWGNNGKVGMRLNGRNNGYVYDMKTTNLWLGVTLYQQGDRVDIISAEGSENK